MRGDNDFTDEQREKVKERLSELRAELEGRQDAIDYQKGKLRSQIASIKETITKILNEDVTLGEKVRTLFREQGITIASVLTAFGMAIGVLVEALLPKTVVVKTGGSGGGCESGGGKGGTKE